MSAWESDMEAKFKALEKKVEAGIGSDHIWMANTTEEIKELKEYFEAFKEGEADDIKEIGILREEIAELKEHNHPEIIGKKEIYNLDFINKRLEDVLRELHELMRGLVSDLQDSNSLSKATIKCYEGKLIKNLEKLDSKTEDDKCKEATGFSLKEISSKGTKDLITEKKEVVGMEHVEYDHDYVHELKDSGGEEHIGGGYINDLKNGRLYHIHDESLPEPMFICGNCEKVFKSYHDGDGINTSLCPNCLTLQDTVGLNEDGSVTDSKPPDPLCKCGHPRSWHSGLTNMCPCGCSQFVIDYKKHFPYTERFIEKEKSKGRMFFEQNNPLLSKTDDYGKTVEGKDYLINKGINSKPPEPNRCKYYSMVECDDKKCEREEKCGTWDCAVLEGIINKPKETEPEKITLRGK